MVMKCQICKRIQTYEVVFTPSFIKKFAPASVGIKKLEMEGCVECGWLCVGQKLDGF